MVNSEVKTNAEKLMLCGYLKNIRPNEYNSPIKLQAFLFFYEVFSKIAGEKANFTSLQGFEKGIGFKSVWEDYTEKRVEFNKMAEKIYQEEIAKININRASESAFIVSTLSEEELSIFMDSADEGILRALERTVPAENITNFKIINIVNCYFVLQKRDFLKLTENHFHILFTLAEQEDLHNPVYVWLDENGALVLD